MSFRRAFLISRASLLNLALQHGFELDFEWIWLVEAGYIYRYVNWLTIGVVKGIAETKRRNLL